MIYQNDDNCITDVRKIGCFVRSCGIIAECKYNELYTASNEEDRLLTAQDINKMWRYGKELGIIDEDNRLINSAKMATFALRLLGDNDGRFIEIATKKNGEMDLYGWARKKGYVPDSFIQKILQNGPSKTHFRVVDKNDNLQLDPHNPPIKMVEPVYTICYKYVY